MAATPPFPDSTYKLIYADPPWKYSNNLGDQARWGAATSAYPCMSVDELIALDLARLADESSCALVMWTTGPKQAEAHAVLQGWGFRYVTFLYVWVKLRKNAPAQSPYKYTDIYSGRGQYTRPNAEFAMLAVRGYSPETYELGIPQVIHMNVAEHSRKPAIFRDLLDPMFGKIPRIELFARERAAGWDSWGNDAVLL